MSAGTATASLVLSVARLAERKWKQLPLRSNAPVVECGQTRRVPVKQFNKCQPCDGFMCGMFGCKQIPGKPEPPLQQLIGWHRRTGWELNGGFYSYSFHRDTVEDIAACWRACEIRDAAIAQARVF